MTAQIPFPSDPPSEVEIARQYLAQLDPSTVSADEYALAVIEARYPTPSKGFGFPEVDPEESPDE